MRQTTIARQRWSKPQVRDLIYANSNMFRRGQTFTEAQMLALFGETIPDFTFMEPDQIRQEANKLALKKVGFQKKINTILDRRGLYMKQRDTIYYDILSRDIVPRQVASMNRTAVKLSRRSAKLQQGYLDFNCNLYPRISNRELGE